jgi:ABC-2 type transport system ATP-binding protein
MVDLDEKASAWVGKLSGGQRQRLAVACALVGDPELLFLDEPTTGLDPQSRREVWDIVNNQKSDGKTTLITTHYMDEAQRLCDRVAVVDHGRIIALGSPADLIHKIGGEHIIEFDLIDTDGGAARVEVDALAALPAVSSTRCEGGAYTLTVTEPHRALPALINKLQDENLELARITTRHVSLEDVFVTLTGRHLADEEISSD